MLKQSAPSATRPNRVVVVGARGFIARHLLAHLSADGTEVLPVGSSDIDLTAPDAGARLAALLKPSDSVVMLSAITPDKGRDIETMMRNLAMGRSVCEALGKQPCAHVVYVSSDAVYPFGTGLVNEESLAAPTDLYGCMHRTREVMFQTVVTSPLAILRPTLVYGADDTHNSYGPNRFRRQAAKDKKIVLGGEGEETRDHIAVEDVVQLISNCLFHRSSGVLNLATGRSISFHDIAKVVAAQFDETVPVEFTKRGSPITHRAFDVTQCRKAFPSFAFTPLENGVAAAHRLMKVGT